MSEPHVDIAALATLARIEVSKTEQDTLAKEIPNILAFVDTIQKVDTEASTADPSLRNVMRDDTEPHESGIYTEALLSQAPTRVGDKIAVKQVVSRKSTEGTSASGRK